jgi:uncharacterized membrane protein
MKSKLAIALAFLAFAGLMDATYLTWQHYSGGAVTCSITHGCEQVLGSQYAMFFMVPLSLLGAIYYGLLFFAAIGFIDTKNILFLKFIAVVSGLGVIMSGYLFYLQAWVINSFCIYCLTSAVITVLIFVLAIRLLKLDR